MVIHTAPSTPDAIQAMRDGRAVAVLGDYPAMAYQARESAGRLEVVGEQFGVAPYGIAVGEDAEPLRVVVASTLSGLQLDGTYRRILETWALEAGEVPPGEPPTSVPSVDQVPQLADGTLRVGMEIAYPPMEFFDESRAEAGVDVELARAIGQALGVQVELVNLPFDELFSKLRSGDIDMAISSITITPERSREVGFVPYFQAGSGILVPASNPAGIRTPRDLCEHPVAVQEGTVHVGMLERACQ
jgi:polar amino acid transport system substrate-binding protein